MTRWSLTEHPHAVGETYFEHMAVASGFGARMVLGGLACLLHGLLPFLFTRTGSRTIGELHAKLSARSVPLPAPATSNVGQGYSR